MEIPVKTQAKDCRRATAERKSYKTISVTEGSHAKPTKYIRMKGGPCWPAIVVISMVV